MAMQDYELDAWLGDDWTPEQREQIIADWREYERGHPDLDQPMGEAILTAICQLHDGVLEIPHDHAVRAAVIVSCLYGGMSESEAHRQSGRDRGTVRRWLGK